MTITYSIIFKLKNHQSYLTCTHSLAEPPPAAASIPRRALIENGVFGVVAVDCAPGAANVTQYSLGSALVFVSGEVALRTKLNGPVLF